MCSSSSRSPGIRTAFRPASSTAFLITCTEQVLLVKSLSSYCCTGGCSCSSIPFRPDALQEALQVMPWLRGLPYLSIFMLREVRDCPHQRPSRAYASATALPIPESPPVTRAFCMADPQSLGADEASGFLHGRPTHPWVLMRQVPRSCQVNPI